MVSTGMSLDSDSRNGPYRLGRWTSTDGSVLSYGQVYIYDVEIAAQFRKAQPSNQGCDPVLMKNLTRELQAVNRYMSDCKTLNEMIASDSSNGQNLLMNIVEQRGNAVQRVEETAGDVAAVFQAIDDEPPGNQQIQIYPRDAESIICKM
ncbi:unnamed protein product [Diabrotica balteata]|uniref:Uncharacterized protein n=1 Tax=Diabrotica balteata TaxID=107213 RepID=A0A9N9TF59_DIABA|nr:unnamed protein product [Diabrotica balteata]